MATWMHILTYAEFLLVAVAYAAFLRTGYAARFKAFHRYLLFRVISTFIAEAVFIVMFRERSNFWAYIYFFVYWGTYLITAGLTILVAREICNELMRPVAGLRRLGVNAFRGIAIISGGIGLAIALAAGIQPMATVTARIVYVAECCLHCVSVLELCLLAFLMLTVRPLGRSFRSPLFGIALGFSLEAASQFVTITAVRWSHTTMDSISNLMLEIVTDIVLVMWTVYFLLPKEQEPAAVPSKSPLLRWNDVAQALGHNSPRVVMGASTGFVRDVERVMDQAMAQNRMNGIGTDINVG